MTNLTHIYDDKGNASTITETNSEETSRTSKCFRNIGRECFERVQSEWRKSNKTESPAVERTSSSSPSIPYDHLVQIFLSNVTANRNSALPQPLSLVDAVEILSTAWESDAASSYE